MGFSQQDSLCSEGNSLVGKYTEGRRFWNGNERETQGQDGNGGIWEFWDWGIPGLGNSRTGEFRDQGIPGFGNSKIGEFWDSGMGSPSTHGSLADGIRMEPAEVALVVHREPLQEICLGSHNSQKPLREPQELVSVQPTPNSRG